MKKNEAAVSFKLTASRIRIAARVNIAGAGVCLVDGIPAGSLVLSELKRQFSYENPFFACLTGNGYDFPEREGQRIKLSFELTETSRPPCVTFFVINARGISSELFFPTWRRRKNKYILLFTGDMRNGGSDYSAHQFSKVAAHEFGHALGLGDLYAGFAAYSLRSRPAAPVTPEMPSNDIMRTCFRNDWFTPNDLEMAVMAYQKDQPQSYCPLRFYKGIDKASEALRYRPER